MRIGIVGSRNRNSMEDYTLVERAFLQLRSDGDSIVSGGCPSGGDRFAEIIAAKFDVPIEVYSADWRQHGRSAGFRRNGIIAAKSDVLIACVGIPGRGTRDTINKFRQLHVGATIKEV